MNSVFLIDPDTDPDLCAIIRIAGKLMKGSTFYRMYYINSMFKI